MNKRTKLQQILAVLDPKKGTSVDFSQFDSDIAQFKEALTEKIQATTIDDVYNQLEKFKKKLDFKSMLEALDNLETTLDQKIKGVTGLLNQETISLKELLTQRDEVSNEKIASVASNIGLLKNQLDKLTEQKNTEIAELKKQTNDFETETNKTFKNIQVNLIKLETDSTLSDQIRTLGENSDTLRRELINRINHIGGGNMNRNIAIGGNTSVLSRYTDINIKAGANVTLTYSNNNTTKYLDLTIGSSGGGGSVGGTVRSINNISSSQTAGATAGTDFVYIATAGVALTLPTAAANTNLYTVKNTAASSILIATTGGETIDTQANLILATQYTSVDLISDGTNWEIT